MSNDVAVYDATPLPDLIRKPEVVLAEAKEAAKSLINVVRQAKLARKFGGDHEHLAFEAWQVLGKFYGITAKVVDSEYVEFGTAQGFTARAVAITREGMEISAAESMCLSDEPNWAKKPLFQLKSMAQTRSSAKALRNVLAWVVVLAGYSPTPAEEMTGNEYNHNPVKYTMKEPESKPDTGLISDPQKNKIMAMLSGKGYKTEETKHQFAATLLGKEAEGFHFSLLTKAEASKLIEEIPKAE